MAAINDLLKQVQDENLRSKLEDEFNKLKKTKKFGLVFEEHLPECTPLYDVKVKKGSTVAKKNGVISEMYEVSAIKGDMAICYHKMTSEMEQIPVDELVCVAQFGEPIYPYLQPIDSICNAPDSDLWHTLIEADNYHALQLLEYLYAGKVDCIYIDPPYNTSQDEWKYNDSFVDSTDCWAHSKWLSMMKKRLTIAAKLLSESGNLIISIGYQEIHRLVLLCEELFPNKQIVPITVQTSGGKPSGGFNYLHEYLVFIVPHDFKSNELDFVGGNNRSPFEGLTLATFTQTQRPNQTYPIFVDKNTGRIVGCGKSLAERMEDGSFTGEKSEFDFDYSEAPEGCEAVWPVTSKGEKCVWRLISDRLMHDWDKGYIKVSENRSKKNKNRYSIQYLPDGVIKKIVSGKLQVLGTTPNAPTLLFGENTTVGADIPTIWTEKEFFTTKGTSLIQAIFGNKEFQYPKPLSLIMEIIKGCAKENSIILDFFAGSGTTLNAVNLLNELDGGSRRCVLVTNNELSKKKTKELEQNGVDPGSSTWENCGICRSITWPRIVNTIRGENSDGQLIEGEYYSFNGSNKLISDGFSTNAIYFKLGFLDKNAVALGRQLSELMPLLWLKAGAHGACPILNKKDTRMVIYSSNRFAILINENDFREFQERVREYSDIQTIYFVTDSSSCYREMAVGFEDYNTYQLYRDYLDNFRINTGRTL